MVPCRITIIRMPYLLGFALLLLSCFLTSGQDVGTEVDISWDFATRDREGWANATAEEMSMQVRIENGELRSTVLSWNPHLDSPVMLIPTTRRHFVVFRMMYFGSATKANLLLKYGPSVGHEQHFDELKANWQARLPVSIASVSSGQDTAEYAVDASPHSAWTATQSRGAWIILDLGDFRWISKLRIRSSGENSAPRRCFLQKSQTSGPGPFVTVVSFTLEFTLDEQIVEGFDGHSRYWRFFVVDNFNGTTISVRDIGLEGNDEGVASLPFALDNSGKFKNYYLPIYTVLQGSLARMRLQIQHDVYSGKVTSRARPTFRESLAIDYIRIARGPEVWKVRGCLVKYYDNKDQNFPTYNVTSKEIKINNQLPLRYFELEELPLQYASTYDCPRSGNVDLRIDGINFGPRARVWVGENECPVTASGTVAQGSREEFIICRLPADTTDGTEQLTNIRVESGTLPGLFNTVPYFSYRRAPPAPQRPVVTNVGARRVDLVWSPPGDVFDNMMTTGYQIMWFQPQYRTRMSNLTVGNVTTTSIRGLEPDTVYVFAVAAMVEGAVDQMAATAPTDLYGRRDPLSNMVLSPFSIFTNITRTLKYDFDFSFFNANATLNSSGISASASLGPTGQWGGEGNYGLIIVGSAQIENCNVSSTCCDGYNATLGLASCGTSASVCAVLLERRLAYEYVVDGVTRRQTPSNEPYDDGSPPEKVVLTLDELIANKGAELPTMPCGPALRLTPSGARESGASWYRRKVNVREGFDTTIKFEISNPSMRCNRLDDVNTYCRSRGADGLAFVIQSTSPVALGLAGSGMGYEGIFNSLAVEVDTFFNYDQMDFYENHISIQTQGFRYNITANHSRSLATTTRVPDLTDGRHTLRIRYDPNFDENAVLHPSFQTNGYTTWFLENADFQYGGDGDWGTGFGLIYVYLDDMYSPVITAPLNLEKTLKLDDGRMYVGLTAATGNSHWQVHDILQWQFTSLYIDRDYTPPLVVNGIGSKDCVNMTECVNFPDFDHYMRKNNIWGKGHDSTETWQTGREGYCAFC